MKRLILLLALVVGMTAFASAQDFQGQIGTVNKVMANAAADTINLTIPKSRSSITFHYQVTKNSGTVAGTIVLQSKVTGLAGEVWHTLNSYTITDATAENWLNFTSNQGYNYRVITTTTGTQNSTHNKYLLYRQ